MFDTPTTEDLSMADAVFTDVAKAASKVEE